MPGSRFTTSRGSRGGKSGVLTTADLLVLSLLAERAMHGYQLLAEYERQEVADWASVSKAQIYYAIQKLAGLGLIEPTGRSAAQGERDRTEYAPTDEGRRELTTALTKVEWARSRVPQPFATWLGLSIHLPQEEVSRVLQARRSFLEEELAREYTSLRFIETLGTKRARAGEAVVRLVIRQLQAELDWLTDLLDTHTR